ncbi:MAG: hypothetical protein VYD21_02725 [Candidatus Thermoplasmatota archaeon]|nr:hypothetical protein [Candidatus Thermoplasmatota archaeon]
MSDKSIKLNRDLDKMLAQAIERDLLVRIGWGREGDEKPKNGEIGALSMLPENSRSLLLGELGEGAGLLNRGGTATIQGSVSSIAGGWMSSGRLVIEKDAGSRTGFCMSGGSIVVHGSVGNFGGSNMSGGTLLIRGDAGSNLGSSMVGGTIILMGSADFGLGSHMTGGVIVVCGNHHHLDDSEMKYGQITDVPQEALDLAFSLGIEIPSGATVLLKAVDHPKDKLPILERGHNFAGIGIIASGTGRNDPHISPDISVTIKSRREEGREILLPRPWMEIQETSTKNGASIVLTDPKPEDILIIGSHNIGKLGRGSLSCLGFVLDIDSLPTLNDAEVEAVIVSIRSRMPPGSLVILSDRVDRVDELARRSKELELDGILVDAISLDSAGPTVALPRIGMANKKHRISENGGFVLIRLDGKASPKRLIIAKSAGIDAVVSPELDGSELDFDSRLRGILREMGLSSISSTNRSNIRALDHNVAMQTGLRLVGLERPLPTWTRGD